MACYGRVLWQPEKKYTNKNAKCLILRIKFGKLGNKKYIISIGCYIVELCQYINLTLIVVI